MCSGVSRSSEATLSMMDSMASMICKQQDQLYWLRDTLGLVTEDEGSVLEGQSTSDGFNCVWHKRPAGEPGA